MHILFFFLLGAIIGSFLNVVLLRLHTGKSLQGRSHCMSCGTTLQAKDLVPVLSYLWLRGRCRYCSARIPGRYALVELLTAGLFALTALAEPDPVLRFAKLAIVSILVVIFFYDLAHFIIPDELAIALVPLALLVQAWNPESSQLMWPPFGGLIAAGLVFVFFWGLWRVSRGRWIGLGDAKLAAPLALAVGASAAASFVILAFWIGAIVSLAVLALGRVAARRRGTTRLSFLRLRLTIKSEVPLAPFLIASYVLVIIFHADVFAFTNTFLFRFW